MKRSQFFVLAAIVPGVFGLVMMAVPDVMLRNSLAAAPGAATGIVTQWVGFGVFSLAVINFLSRHDPGSPALRAVMIGNILFHTLGIGFDVYDYLAGFMTPSGVISGIIPHSILAIGFVYFLSKHSIYIEELSHVARPGR
jgi:hypothetical protein